MANSRNERQRKNRARKEELAQRRDKAYRRRQGLSPDEEESELAPYFRRVIALAFDQVLFFFFFMFFIIFAISIFGESIGGQAVGYLPIYVFGAIYFIPKIARKGQTFGCKKMKIIVIREDGKGLLDFQHSAIRWAIYYGFPTTITLLISMSINSSGGLVLAGIANLIAFAIVSVPIIRTPLRQGLHDRLSGAVVVREVKFGEKV